MLRILRGNLGIQSTGINPLFKLPETEWYIICLLLRPSQFFSILSELFIHLLFQTDTVNKARDLKVGKQFLVIIRVYEPFRHKVGVRNNHRLRCNQEIVLLGHQMLTDLRDKIHCPSDFAVAGELSENPDADLTQRTMVSINFLPVVILKAPLVLGVQLIMEPAHRIYKLAHTVYINNVCYVI